MGMNWSCSETKFYAEPGWGDMYQYFLESRLTAELGAVADTFLGVDGMFRREAHEHMHHDHVEVSLIVFSSDFQFNQFEAS